MERGRLNRDLSRQSARLRSAQTDSIEPEKLLLEERDLQWEGSRRLHLIKPIPSDTATLIVSILLVVDARISFRAGPRVLSCIDFQGWISPFSSIIN